MRAVALNASRTAGQSSSLGGVIGLTLMSAMSLVPRARIIVVTMNVRIGEHNIPLRAWIVKGEGLGISNPEGGLTFQLLPTRISGLELIRDGFRAGAEFCDTFRLIAVQCGVVEFFV